VNAVLNLRASADERDAARAALVSALVRATHDESRLGHRLTVPLRFRSRTLRVALRQTYELRACGYPVHGPLGRIVPRFAALPTHPRRADVLEVLLDTCLGLASADAQLRRPR
jgi:hypothetical protein